MRTTLHDEQDRSADDQILHDGYQHIPGPEPFLPGSPEALALAVELDRLATSQIPNYSQAKTPNVPVSLKRKKERQSGTVDQCPRATRRVIEDGDKMQVVFLPCNARTCGFCKDAVDESAAARLVHSLGTDKPYVATIPIEEWEKTRKRVHRMRKDGADAVAVKMGTRTTHDEIAVVMSGPFVENARPVGIGEIVELVVKRPPNAPLTSMEYENGKIRHRAKGRRVHMTGPGLVSVREWEAEGSPGEKVKRRAEPMNRKVTADAVEICAQVLGFRVKRYGHNLTIYGHWDSPEAKAFRAWSRDPDGSLEWSRMLHEAKTATGEAPIEEVPDEVYDRQLALEAIA